MYFYVDDGKELVDRIKDPATLLGEDVFYKNVDKKGLHLSTILSMRISDRMKMVKMIHLCVSK